MLPRLPRPIARVGWLMSLTLVLCLCIRPLEAETFAGKIDPGFNTSLTSGVETQALAVLPSGEILVGGNFVSGIVQLETNGSVDPAFQLLGAATAASTTISAIAVQSDGEVIVGGILPVSGDEFVSGFVRLNADGTLDSAFHQNSDDHGTFMGPVDSIVLQPDGKILLGGSFSFFAPFSGTGVEYATVGISRLNADGSPDTTFNAGTGVYNSSNGVGTIYSVALQPDGKILLGGSFASVNGTARANIARLNTDGSVDTDFDPGSGADGTIYSVALQADGKILFGGSFAMVNGTARASVARLNADGSVDTGFDPGSGADGAVNAVAVQGNGLAVIAGAFTMVNGVASPGVARLNPDGSRDPAFHPVAGPDNAVASVAIQSDGTILLGGSFTAVAGIAETTVSRLRTDGSVDTSFSPNTQSGVTIMSLAQQPDDQKVIVGGIFVGDGLDVIASPSFVRLQPDGSLDPAFQASVGGVGQAVLVRPDNELVVACNFDETAAYADPSPLTPLPDPGGTASASAEGVYHPLPQVSTNVKVPVKKYPVVGKRGHNKVSVIAVLRPDGSQDPSFNAIYGYFPVLALALQPDGKILAGTSGAGLFRSNADSSYDGSFAPDASLTNSTVSALAVQPADGEIIAGYYTYNATTGTGTANVARLNAGGSLDGNFSLGTADGTIQAIAVQADGKIIVGGAFQTFDGAAETALVRLNADGSLDNGFLSGVFLGPDGTLPEVSSLQIQADGRILVAGQFVSIGGVARNNLARLNTDGSLDADFDPGDGGDEVIRAALLLANGEILTGGDFSVVNGSAHAGVALLLDPAVPPPVIASPGALSAVVGQPFGYQIVASNAPTSFGAGGLPGGLSVNTATGIISGVPTVAGSFNVSLSVASAGGIDTAAVPLTVSPAPMITVMAGHDGLAVAGGKSGKVIFARTGDISGTLTVRYKVKGSAKAGIDYKALGGTLVIPAGVSQVNLKIKAIDNVVIDGVRVAKVILLPSTDGSYTAVSPATAKIKIIDND